MKQKKQKVQMTRVIVDPSDGRLDKFIPLSEAKKLYQEGKLAYDTTNKSYCTTAG